MIGTSSMMTERTRGDSLKNKNCTIKTMNKSKARSLFTHEIHVYKNYNNEFETEKLTLHCLSCLFS